MATVQIRIDDTVKKQADTLFPNLGLDTSTALPYQIQEAVYDSRSRRDLNGPFDNAEDAVASMLEDRSMYKIVYTDCIKRYQVNEVDHPASLKIDR